MSRAAASAAACALAVLTLAPSASADTYAVVSHCGWTLTNKPGTTEIVLVLLAEAHATSSLPAATTSVTCTVVNKYRESLTASGSSVGKDVYAVSARSMTFAPPSYCVSSTAVWVDATTVATHTEVEAEHCEAAHL